MGLQFWLGASGSGKSYRLYQHIIEEAKNNPSVNYLVVVPDQFTMQTQHDLVVLSPNKGIMNIDVLSFGRLTHRILEEVGGAKKPVLDDTGKSLVLRKVAIDVEEDLTVMKRNVKKIGYVHEVKSALSEFMQYGLGLKEVEKLTEYAKKRGSLSYKLKDLETLYAGFLKYIDEKYITKEETLDILRGKLSKSKIVKNSVIIFDGFTGFTPVQYNVIEELMVQTKKVIMALTIDVRQNPYEVDAEQNLFHLTKKTIADLKMRADRSRVKLEKDVIIDEPVVYRYKDNEGLSHLEREIFRFPSKPFEKEQDNVRIFEATNPREEMRQICIAIKKLIREQGYAYRDIAVVTGDTERYAYVAEEEFTKFEIPFFLDQTNKLVLNPFIEYIRSALQVIIQDFSYEAVFHFLRSGLTGVTTDEVDALENFVIKYGIRGKNKWTRAFVMKKDAENHAKELMDLNNLREKIVTRLSALMITKASGKEIIEALYQFIVDADMEEKLSEYEQKFEDEGNYVKAKEYGQIYRLVMDLLDQMYELIGDEELPLEEFAQILDAGFAEIKVGMIPQTVDKVVIGDIERTRLNQIKTLFFAGVNDGIIPKGNGAGGIISDIDREFLSESEFELAPTPRQKMFIQRLYLYLMMTKPAKSLVLSYSLTDNEGKSIRPAYLIGTVKALFPKLTIENPELAPIIEQMESTKDTMDKMVALLRNYADGEITEDKSLFFTLYNTYLHENPELMKKLTKAAFFSYESSPIPKELARALYGQILVNSVSRLEKFASCAYAHFLQYGLRIDERKEFGFESVDMGTIFHDTLESFSKRLPEEGFTWFDFPMDRAADMLKEIIDETAATYGETILYSSKRNEYMIDRMNRIMQKTVETLQYQLKQGAFVPESFELSFGKDSDYKTNNHELSSEEKMTLQGRIDRIDTAIDEDKLYIKIVDYKSSSKDFKLDELYNGLQLQLAVYMNVAMEEQKRRHPENEVIPAAMFYYHLDDPIVEVGQGAPDIENVKEMVYKDLKVKGIINEDEEVVNLLDDNLKSKADSLVIPVKKNKDGSYSKTSRTLTRDNFDEISKFVDSKIVELGKNILNGEVACNPYEMGQRNACTYCAYKGACGFDKKLGADKVRKLFAMKEEEAMEAIKKSNERDGEK